MPPAVSFATLNQQTTNINKNRAKDTRVENSRDGMRDEKKNGINNIHTYRNECSFARAHAVSKIPKNSGELELQKKSWCFIRVVALRALKENSNRKAKMKIDRKSCI